VTTGVTAARVVIGETAVLGRRITPPRSHCSVRPGCRTDRPGGAGGRAGGGDARRLGRQRRVPPPPGRRDGPALPDRSGTTTPRGDGVRISFELDGRQVTSRGPTRRDPDGDPAAARRGVGQGRLRERRLRVVRGPRRRAGRHHLPAVRRAGRWPHGPHRRGPRDRGRPAPLQQALLDAGGVQCGFCTPGILVAAMDLLSRATGPERAGHPDRPRRQPVPLHRVRQDRRGGPGSRRGCSTSSTSPGPHAGGADG
jgi:hypothetical protein